MSILWLQTAMMGDTEQTIQDLVLEDECDSLNYKPPAEKSLNDIVNQDQDDDSLQRYKAQLLGSSAHGEQVVVGKQLNAEPFVTLVFIEVFCIAFAMVFFAPCL